MQLQNKRVLVTGANGFIGGRLVERLATEEGAQVYGMVRDTKTWKVSQTFQVSHADLTDPVSLKHAVADCDIVVHCAAMQYKGALEDFRRINVQGTLDLLRAAKDAGVSRFVHLSTINVLGYPPPQNANADSPLVFSGDAYSVSKSEGERAARKFASKHQFPLTIIRPGCTYGPKAFAWTLTPIARLRRGTPVLIGKGDGICNAIYIDNLVDLILLALKNDAAIGHTFMGTEGRGVPWRDFYSAYAKMSGIRHLRSLPRALALGLAMASESVAQVTGRAPFVSRASVEFYTHRVVYDIEKSRAILGYEPRITFEEGMKRTESWLKANSFSEMTNAK